MDLELVRVWRGWIGLVGFLPASDDKLEPKQAAERRG